MSNLCQRIENRLPCLPPKDEELCRKFLKERDFEKMLEIAKSDLIMKQRDELREVHQGKWEKIDTEALQELVTDLQTYLSFLEIPYEEMYAEEVY